MSTLAQGPRDHRFRRMTGRDPEESHRTATPLELLFDLTLVVAFSQAGTQMAHLLELGHYGPAIGAFSFSVFAICWAWINYSWQASAFDNDDVFFRVATMVQMLGVLILALGLPQMFHSIDEGAHVDNSVVVAGYVVMRVAAIALWLRVARHDPSQRRNALTYALLMAIAQVGWIVQIFTDPPLGTTVVVVLVLGVFEMLIPVVAELRGGRSPWHPHHIAERYGLLVIITLGEIVLGTILAVSAVIESQGWSVEAVLVAFGGTALAFGLWWVYFMMPSAEVLARHRERGFVWGYGHLLIFGSLAATGAGLHVAATVIEHVAHISASAAILTLVIPVAIFTTALFLLYSFLLREFDPFHVLLFVGAILALAASALAVAAGATVGVGIVIAACSPLVLIVGYETLGHRHQAAALERALE
ncbi:low temperature requirement protein A [Glycomyces algeriensis]|uniref:Membrane protein n=1 Tax=Glycomyces algeriensis TaxID=256037 RepID=A0A9W6GE62_9ACTN|nr:low temperature requirement protein A [Glycomyces algeriensis]MDA1368563.1 low temperature requirement protein A [Glycomyces algeriensis]MDR7352362.1 low temperature requirement protein LtrA [Glycomyces algeriensis]GLI45099.1 membrane protein [Glycomyces algeriensis]